jgi:group I intron endonuclease
MGYIYLIINKINGKKYVGQSIQYDINRRWNQHMNNISGKTYLSNAFIKYGRDNFKFKIICICFDEDCNRYEEEYIKSFNTISPNGYNLRYGGNNSHLHPDTIKLIKSKITDEYKEKMSKIVKLALEKRKLDGYTQSINSLENLKKACEKRKRKVRQYTNNGIFISEFNSIKEAELKTNINNRRISYVCNGKKELAGGFVWKII